MRICGQWKRMFGLMRGGGRLAYCLGQTKNKAAIKYLEKVLRDESEDPMVRHESAEALGALGDPSSLPILQKYLSDSSEYVRQTCEIAIEKIEWENSEKKKTEKLQQRYNKQTCPGALANIMTVPMLPLTQRLHFLTMLLPMSQSSSSSSLTSHSRSSIATAPCSVSATLEHPMPSMPSPPASQIPLLSSATRLLSSLAR